MSDTRLLIAGTALVFAGFASLGALGDGFRAASLESAEFGTCHEYTEDGPPAEVDCAARVSGQALFFALVAGLVGAGVALLVMGARGDWDGRVRPGDMAGPGRGGTRA